MIAQSRTGFWYRGDWKQIDVNNHPIKAIIGTPFPSGNRWLVPIYGFYSWPEDPSGVQFYPFSFNSGLPCQIYDINPFYVVDADPVVACTDAYFYCDNRDIEVIEHLTFSEIHSRFYS